MTCSLQRLLLILGLVIVPFYEIFLKALPFVRNMSPDSRVPKELIALVFALSIGLIAVFQGNIKPFRNKFLIVLPAYLLFNLIMCPHFPLAINGVDSGDFYFWKPFSEVICFSLMIFAIASMEMPVESILKIMVICGAVMAGYVILQQFGFDQFWWPKEGGEFTSVRKYTLGGNLGQPTIVASWIVMIIPLAVYLKRWWLAALMIIAVLCTESAMAYGALVFIGIAYLSRWKMEFIGIFLFLFLVFFGAFIFNHKLQSKIIDRMDGRYEVWKNICHDIKHGQIKDGNNFSITGIGFGKFSFLFPIKHPAHSQFDQAHNDILEFIYNCGLVGGVLLLAGIFIMVTNINFSSTVVFSIFLSFIAIFLCSLGSFPFQLGAHQFYSAVLVGLLHNDKLSGGIKCYYD